MKISPAVYFRTHAHMTKLYTKNILFPNGTCQQFQSICSMAVLIYVYYYKSHYKFPTQKLTIQPHKKQTKALYHKT